MNFGDYFPSLKGADGMAMPDIWTSARSGVLVAAVDAATDQKKNADYICDGIADQVEINAALTAGGVVILTKGNYYISGSIIVATNNVLIGQGVSTILNVSNSTNDHAIKSISSESVYFVEIGGFRIEGNKANNTSGHGIYAYNAHTWRIRNLHIKESGDIGVKIYGTSGALALNNVIENCRIENTKNQCVFIEAYAPNNHVKNNIIGGCDTWYCIEAANVEQIITGNHIHTAALSGIYLNGAARSIVSGNIIESSVADHGISINADNCIVTSNVTFNNNDYGIYCNNSKSIIANNRCLNKDGSTAQDYGIYLDTSSSSNVVTGNIITDNQTGTISNSGTANRIYGNIDGTLDTLVIRDGITAPATIASHASIYVDTADGDLKVKFGDGTVKTIVVDT